MTTFVERRSTNFTGVSLTRKSSPCEHINHRRQAPYLPEGRYLLVTTQCLMGDANMRTVASQSLLATSRNSLHTIWICPPTTFIFVHLPWTVIFVFSRFGALWNVYAGRKRLATDIVTRTGDYSRVEKNGAGIGSRAKTGDGGTGPVKRIWTAATCANVERVCFGEFRLLRDYAEEAGNDTRHCLQSSPNVSSASHIGYRRLWPAGQGTVSDPTRLVAG